MRGPKITTVASKKMIPSAAVSTGKKLKANLKQMKKEKASKKNSGAPKRPLTAFFLFMEGFRKTYKENFPHNKSAAAVTKAGSEKWKAMSEQEKSPYAAEAISKKAEYEKALSEFNANPNGKETTSKLGSSENSSDDDEQEASSSS